MARAARVFFRSSGRIDHRMEQGGTPATPFSSSVSSATLPKDRPIGGQKRPSRYGWTYLLCSAVIADDVLRIQLKGASSSCWNGSVGPMKAGLPLHWCGPVSSRNLKSSYFLAPKEQQNHLVSYECEETG